MQRVGQAKNARANDNEIKGLIHVMTPSLTTNGLRPSLPVSLRPFNPDKARAKPASAFSWLIRSVAWVRDAPFGR
jgi:hypothetical protein